MSELEDIPIEPDDTIENLENNDCSEFTDGCIFNPTSDDDIYI